MNAAFHVGPLGPDDRSRVVDIVRATGVFRDDEVGVAMEVFDEGMLGEYELLGVFEGIARHPERSEGSAFPDWLVGYAAYGPTVGTDRTYDLYWIAVDPTVHGRGAGTVLLDGVEQAMRARDARLVVVETSSREEYADTRRFYARRGYSEVARMREFYAPGDDRVIFTKRMATPVSGHGVAA